MSLFRAANGAIFAALMACSAPAFADDSETKASEWELKPRWRLQVDTAQINGPDGLVGTGSFTDVRRAQLGVDLKMPHGFSARIEGEFSSDPIQFVDAYIAWDGHGVNITAGQQKTFTSLDDMTSDLNTSFLERAAFMGAFNTTRRLGVSAGYAKGQFMVNGGVFTEPFVALNDVPKNSVDIDLRAVWMPEIGDTKLHFGGSLHLRDRNDLANIAQRYRRRALLNITTDRFVATPSLSVESETSYGFEAAAVHGRFHVAGEVHRLHADRRATTADPTFLGTYVEAGFFLTDDTRPLSGGQFGAVTPKKPLGSGGIGALQFNVRYDYLTLNSAGITGGVQNAYLASLIWTPTENFRLLGQYTRLDYTDAAIAVAGNRDYSLNVWALRGQITF